MAYLPQIAAISALLLLAGGLGALLIHRHLFFMLIALNYALCGVILLLGAFSSSAADSRAEYYGLLVLVVGEISALLATCALALYFKKHRSLDMAAPNMAEEEI